MPGGWDAEARLYRLFAQAGCAWSDAEPPVDRALANRPTAPRTRGPSRRSGFAASEQILQPR